jgi:hypothetical protein
VVAAAEVDGAAARETMLDGRGRDDIVGTEVDGLGEVTDLAVVGSFFTVVEVDVDGASDKRFDAVVGSFAAVVVAVRVGAEVDGAKDSRDVVVVVGFFTVGWVVPLLRVVLDVPGLACEEVPIRLGRLAEGSLTLGVSLVVPGFGVIVALAGDGLVGVEVEVSAPFEGPLGKTAFSATLDGPLDTAVFSVGARAGELGNTAFSVGVWAGPLGKTAFSETLTGLLGETTFCTGLWAVLLCVGDVLPGVYTGFNKKFRGIIQGDVYR